MAEIKQEVLIDKLSLFLKELGDEDLSQVAKRGLCNSFVFMQFRSILFGLQDKNLDRMQQLMEQDKKTICDKATCYREYKEKRRRLIEITSGETDDEKNLVALNQQVNNLYQELHELRKASEEKKQNRERIIQIEKRLRAIREIREEQENLIKKIIKTQFGNEKWIKVIEAEDLYFYTHTLIAVFNPGVNFDFHLGGFNSVFMSCSPPKLEDMKPNEIVLFLEDEQLTAYWIKDGKIDNASFPENAVQDIAKKLPKMGERSTDRSLIQSITSQYCSHMEEKYVSQEDYVEILAGLKLQPLPDALSPDGEAKEQSLSAAKDFQIAFNFTKNELIKLFNNTYHKKTICKGDLIRLGSSNHAIFLHVTEQGFQLHDPGLIELKDSSPETLVSAIEKRFFTRFKGPDGGPLQSEYMPIGITIFTKTNKEQKPIERPNRVEVIEKMLAEREKVNINGKAWDGATAAWMSARYGHVDTIHLLIKKQADLNQPNNRGETPAWIAAQNGHANVIQALAEAKADLNQPNNERATPAHIAAQNGHANVIQALAEAKANLNQPYNAGFTPAYIAAQNGHVKVIQALAEAKANLNQPDNEGVPPAYIAAQNGHAMVIQALAEAKADLNQPDNGGVTPACIAAQNGHANVIQALAEAKADLNQPDNEEVTPAFMAAQNGHANVIQALAEAKADLNQPDNGGVAPAYIAAQNGHVKVIQALAEAKANLNQPNNAGATPAYIAAQNGHVKVIQALAEAKANLNQPTNSGATPAYIAAKNGHANVIQALAEAKADLNISYPASCYVLFNHAERVGYKQTLNELFKKHNIDSRSSLMGFTALHAAVFFGHAEVVKILLKKGACINDKAGGKIHALDFAVAMGCSTIAIMLMNQQLDELKIEKDTEQYKACEKLRGLLTIEMKNNKFMLKMSLIFL